MTARRIMGTEVEYGISVPGDPLANTYYQSWLYAAVSQADGDFDGLYVTKDAGTNWTKVRLMQDVAEPFLTWNNLGGGGGNHTLSVAVDPLTGEPAAGESLSRAVDGWIAEWMPSSASGSSFYAWVGREGGPIACDAAHRIEHTLRAALSN